MNRNPKDGEEALSLLLDGNRKFMAGKLTQYDLAARRRELLAGQHPFATVLCCSDSRIDPVKIFDANLGEIFTVESAGNVVDDIAIGSIEYGTGHLHTPILVVLAHEKCGAVTTCCAGAVCTGHLPSIMKRIEPSVVKGDVEASTDASAKSTKKCIIDNSEEVRNLVLEGKLRVVVAKYCLESGEVKILE
ncbi:MAG TPA: carbonic anhydrase [Candidatus Bilamarchaeaceae archaeon]|nr:carbonic anhydrase [Candidatus Bilamarchaeaceae archaeon]